MSHYDRKWNYYAHGERIECGIKRRLKENKHGMKLIKGHRSIDRWPYVHQVYSVYRLWTRACVEQHHLFAFLYLGNSLNSGFVSGFQHLSCTVQKCITLPHLCLIRGFIDSGIWSWKCWTSLNKSPTMILLVLNHWLLGHERIFFLCCKVTFNIVLNFLPNLPGQILNHTKPIATNWINLKFS